jgi:hypothetical protein
MQRFRDGDTFGNNSDWRGRDEWQRVSKARPCPICGRPDWCLYLGPASDPEVVICPRVESSKRAGEAGWLHVLRDERNRGTRTTRTRHVTLRPQVAGGPEEADLGKLAKVYADALPSPSLRLALLARRLGVSEDSLRRLGVGWSAQHWAWTFPMKDAAGEVRGIRLRNTDGRKWAVRGGREGLFLPDGLDASRRLLVCEGPTDTAAALDMGCAAVGRPSCSGGVDLLLRLVRARRPTEVVVVADGDLPGQRGARTLAAELAGYVPAVRVITPPAKDLRAWLQSGATANDLATLIEGEVPLRVIVQASVWRRRHGRRP